MGKLGPEALAELVDRHAAALELFALQWTESAADVVQLAFVRLAALPTVPDRIPCWLYRAVRNGAISALRSETRRRKYEATVAETRPTWFDAGIDDRLDAALASQALASLPQAERECIVARLWGGLTFQEIAEVLEISSSTAHRLYEAGLKSMREKLGVTWLKNRA